MPVTYEEALSKLSMSEIIAMAQPHKFAQNSRRKSECLVAEAMEIQDEDIRRRIVEAAEEKLKESREREQERRQRRNDQRKRKRVDEEENGTQFLKLPPEEQKQACLKAFIDGTSNEALRLAVCVVCGREMWAYEGEVAMMVDLPNKHHLILQKNHHSHTLWKEYLVILEKIEGEGDGAKENGIHLASITKDTVKLYKWFKMPKGDYILTKGLPCDTSVIFMFVFDLSDLYLSRCLF